jgi:hypothetical protein
MPQYHVYSDVSGVCALDAELGKSKLLFVTYCYRVVVDDKAIVTETGTLGYRNVAAGEVQASNEALRHVPNGASVVVHTDLSPLLDMLNKENLKPKANGKPQKILCDAVTAMKEGQSRFDSFEVEYEPRRRRSNHYRFCHRSAYGQARKWREGQTYSAYYAQAAFQESLHHAKMTVKALWTSVRHFWKMIKRTAVR